MRSRYSCGGKEINDMSQFSQKAWERSFPPKQGRKVASFHVCFPSLQTRHGNFIHETPRSLLRQGPLNNQSENIASHHHQSTPPGTVFPLPPPIVLPLTLAVSSPLFPPPPPPAAPLQPSCGLAWRRSMNMGFRPSLSSCLKSSRGFSFRPRQRSWSPWTM